MQAYGPIKKVVILFIITCLLVNIPSSSSNNVTTDENTFSHTRDISSDISILTADGGLQLKITITNTGNSPYYNLDIVTEINHGLIFTPRTKTYTIPFLDDDEQYTLQNQLMGIGINPMNYPHISIFVNQSGDLTLIGQIEAIIIGPFVKIINSVFNEENSFQGYTLYSAEYGTKTYLISNDGDIVHTWNRGNINGMASYLLENGNLLVTDISTPNPHFPVTNLGGATGHVAILDPNGITEWEFEYSTDQYRLHHDVEPMPNGNILMIAWAYKSEDEAIAMGRKPDTLSQHKMFPDHIIEVDPDKPKNDNIVWEWHVWDHLIQDVDPNKPNYGDVSAHPELIDINYGDSNPDFTHINSIDYNADLDQILLSVRYFNEIWIIDHSTTTEEAAGHIGGRYGKGGDILYRWGNPEAYQRGDSNNQQLFIQHDATWIPDGYPGEGNILLFNNRHELPDEQNPNLKYYSSVDEIKPPIDSSGNYFKIGSRFGPSSPVWTFTKENIYAFFSGHLSSAQRLPNGNTLICEGAKGKFFEVTREKNIVWEYTNPYGTPNHVFHIHRYAPDYPGIQQLLD